MHVYNQVALSAVQWINQAIFTAPVNIYSLCLCTLEPASEHSWNNTGCTFGFIKCTIRWFPDWRVVEFSCEVEASGSSWMSGDRCYFCWPVRLLICNDYIPDILLSEKHCNSRELKSNDWFIYNMDGQNVEGHSPWESCKWKWHKRNQVFFILDFLPCMKFSFCSEVRNCIMKHFIICTFTSIVHPEMKIISKSHALTLMSFRTHVTFFSSVYFKSSEAIRILN